MKNKLHLLLVIAMVVWLPGCSEAVDLEDLTIGLVVGVDLDKHNQLVSYFLSPVFVETATRNTQILESHAGSFRSARKEIDSMTTGLAVGGKTQVILLGKRLLEQGDWYPYFDVYFRDSKNSLSPRVVAVDGDVSQIIHTPPRDIPSLSLHLAGLIDTKERRNETVKINLQRFDTQMLDKGVTPFISAVKMEKGRIKLTGTALLDKKGRYVESLNQNETALLHILQGTEGRALSLAVSLAKEQKSEVFDKAKVSFRVNRIHKRTKTKYGNNKFQFDIKLTMSIALTERLFPYDMERKSEVLERQIEKQLKKQFEELFKKCQKRKVDPFGLGQYARAFQYEDWKKVQDDWGAAFAKADVRITVDTNIKYWGPVK